MRAGQVDIIYAEFSGDARILRLLDKLDYIVYDSFFIWLPGCEDEPNVLRRARRVPLSIGAYAFEGVLDFEDRSFEGYCRKIRNLRKRSRFIQTDLIAIHRSMNATFLEAITQLSKDRADS